MVYIPIDVSPKDRNAEHLDPTDPSKTAVTSHGACVCTTQDASACSKTDTAFAKFGPRRYDFLESLPEGTTGTCIRAKKGDALQDTLSTVWTTQERNVCGPECVKTSVRLAVFDEKHRAYTEVCPPGTALKGNQCKAKLGLSDMTKEECREAHGVIRETVQNSLPPMACSVTHEKMTPYKESDKDFWGNVKENWFTYLLPGTDGCGESTGTITFTSAKSLADSAWSRVSGKLVQVSGGETHVWGVNRVDKVYKNQSTGLELDERQGAKVEARLRLWEWLGLGGEQTVPRVQCKKPYVAGRSG